RVRLRGAPGRLDDEGDAGHGGVPEEGGERPFADRARADVLVAVPAGAARVLGVVGVDEFEPPLADGGDQGVEGVLDPAGGREVVARRERVAGVEADAELRVVFEPLEERAEVLDPGAEHVVLAGHGFEEEVGAVLGDLLEEGQDVLADLRHRRVIGLADGGAGVDDDAAGADGPPPHEGVADGRDRLGQGLRAGRPEVHQVRGVDVDGDVGAGAQLRVLGGPPLGQRPAARIGHEHLDGLRADLVGVLQAARGEAAGHGNVRADGAGGDGAVGRGHGRFSLSGPPWSRTLDDRVTDLGRPGHGPRTIVTVEPRGASPPPGDWNRTILPPKPVTLTSKPDSRRARSASRTVRPTTFGTGTFVSLPSSQPIWIGPASTRQSRLLTTIVTPSPRETPVPPAGACSITEFGSLPSTFFLRTVTLRPIERSRLAAASPFSPMRSGMAMPVETMTVTGSSGDCFCPASGSVPMTLSLATVWDGVFFVSPTSKPSSSRVCWASGRVLPFTSGTSRGVRPLEGVSVTGSPWATRAPAGGSDLTTLPLRMRSS